MNDIFTRPLNAGRGMLPRPKRLAWIKCSHEVQAL